MVVHYSIAEFAETLIGKSFWRVRASESLRDDWIIFLILHTNTDIMQYWINLLHVQ